LKTDFLRCAPVRTCRRRPDFRPIARISFMSLNWSPRTTSLDPFELNTQRALRWREGAVRIAPHRPSASPCRDCERLGAACMRDACMRDACMHDPSVLTHVAPRNEGTSFSVVSPRGEVGKPRIMSASETRSDMPRRNNLDSCISRSAERLGPASWHRAGGSASWRQRPLVRHWRSV
jgi:hypothetical protein